MALVSLPGPKSDVPAPLALASVGFRPFFLLAALGGASLVPLWLLMLGGQLTAPTALPASVWHGHELLFGYALAVIAGFLLTAVRNWTGLPTLHGAPLLGAAALWLVARLTAFVGSSGWVVALPNLLLVGWLTFTLGRRVVQVRQWHNLGVIGVLGAMAVAELITAVGPAALSQRALWFGVHLVVVMIVVVGGRIIPVFTAHGAGIETRRIAWLDVSCISSALLFAVSELFAPSTFVPTAVAGAAALLNAARMIPWRGWRALKAPMAWILHVGYAFVPLGMAARAATGLGVALSPTFALHAFTVGAIGVLTLGMLPRVTQGHTGRMLTNKRLLLLPYSAIVLAAVARLASQLVAPGHYLAALWVAGLAWTLAFVAFLALFGRSLLAPEATDSPRAR